MELFVKSFQAVTLCVVAAMLAMVKTLVVAMVMTVVVVMVFHYKFLLRGAKKKKLISLVDDD